MAGSGKRPKPRHQRPWNPGGDEDDEQRLFLEAMNRLDAIPDKDRQDPVQGPRPPQRVKVPRSQTVHPDDRLDLHGLKLEQARFALERFLVEARRHELGLVLVVTGRGHGSPGRVGVLKSELERWVQGEGAAYVRAFAEAPRALGGAGAYLLYLR